MVTITRFFVDIGINILSFEITEYLVKNGKISSDTWFMEQGRKCLEKIQEIILAYSTAVEDFEKKALDILMSTFNDVSVHQRMLDGESFALPPNQNLTKIRLAIKNSV